MDKLRRFERSFGPAKATEGDREGNVKGWPGSTEKPPKVGEVCSGTRLLFRPFSSTEPHLPIEKILRKIKWYF